MDQELLKNYLEGMLKVKRKHIKPIWVQSLLDQMKTDEAYLELTKKFNIPYSKDEIFIKESNINQATLDLYFNYLLSLNKKEYDEIVWSLIALNNTDNSNYTGKLNEMYLEKEKCMIECRNYYDDNKQHNQTDEFSNEFVKLRPLNSDDVEYFLDTIFNTYNNSDIEDGLWYGIQMYNYEKWVYFAILDNSNNLCGVINLSLLEHPIMELKNTYNMGIHLLPEYRDKLIGSNAIKLLCDMAFNKKIKVVQSDDSFEYKMNLVNLDVDYIHAYIKEDNVPSIKAFHHFICPECVGFYKTTGRNNEVIYWVCFSLERNSYGK